LERPVLLGVLSITATIAGIYLYHFLSLYHVIPGMVSRIFRNRINPEVVEFLSVKLTGFVFLGLFPWLFFTICYPVSFSEIGLTFGRTGIYWYLMIGAPLVAVAVMSQTAKNPKNQAVYPQMRLKTWTFRTLCISFTGWGIYLFSYEFLFRGILWFLCFYAFGFWPALAINLAVYSALHLPKGMGETLGAIPLGALVCFFTWLTGSILVAFMTHLAMAVSSEFFSLYYNPGMHFRRNLKNEIS
jgi:membrane protease YdiL (CAAX protease family)